MPNIWMAAAGYLAVLNLLGLGLMGVDKHRARRGVWRIRERTLFLVALLGGSLGSWAGMYLFRHKTKHLAFVLGMPGILAIQIVLGYWAVSRFAG